MPVVNGYVTVEQVRAEFGDDGQALPLPLLEKAINAASRAVDDWCGRRFWQDPAPVARTYRPTSRYRVEVGDISTTDGLVVATDPAGDGTYATTWDAADYQLEPLNADANGGAYAWWEIVALSGSFPVDTRRAGLRVTARWGWSQVPDPVMEATLLRAVQLFKRKEAVYGIASFDEFGPVRISRQDSDVVGLLAPYQRPMVG